MSAAGAPRGGQARPWVARALIGALALAALHWGLQRRRARESAAQLWQRVHALELCWLAALPPERGRTLAGRVERLAELRAAGDPEPACAAPAAAALEAALAHDAVLYRRAPDRAAEVVEAARALAAPSPTSADGPGAASAAAPAPTAAYAARGRWLEQLDRAACALGSAERLFPVESCPGAPEPPAAAPRRAVDAPVGDATGFSLAPCAEGGVLLTATAPAPVPAPAAAPGPAPSATPAPAPAPPSPAPSPAPARRWRGEPAATPWPSHAAGAPCAEGPPPACTVELGEGRPWLVRRGSSRPLPLTLPEGALPATAAHCTDTDALIALRLRSGAVAVRRLDAQGALLDTRLLVGAGAEGAPAVVAQGATLTVAWRRATPGRLAVDVLTRRGDTWR